MTQDVFVRAWRALPAFRAESSGRTWLLAIARRACADAVRRLTRDRRLAGRSAGAISAQIAAADVTSGYDVRELIDALDRDRREAFVLTQVVGCSYSEAAGVAGVPVGTIRSRVARAREDLLEALRSAEAG